MPFPSALCLSSVLPSHSNHRPVPSALPSAPRPVPSAPHAQFPSQHPMPTAAQNIQCPARRPTAFPVPTAQCPAQPPVPTAIPSALPSAPFLPHCRALTGSSAYCIAWHPPWCCCSAPCSAPCPLQCPMQCPVPCCAPSHPGSLQCSCSARPPCGARGSALPFPVPVAVPAPCSVPMRCLCSVQRSVRLPAVPAWCSVGCPAPCSAWVLSVQCPCSAQHRAQPPSARAVPVQCPCSAQPLLVLTP